MLFFFFILKCVVVVTIPHLPVSVVTPHVRRHHSLHVEVRRQLLEVRSLLPSAEKALSLGPDVLHSCELSSNSPVSYLSEEFWDYSYEPLFRGVCMQVYSRIKIRLSVFFSPFNFLKTF